MIQGEDEIAFYGIPRAFWATTARQKSLLA